ncbi:hypothetical protein FQN54_007364 [Arachnomyces sp. PD_36]|nr:hypothetical protein FQN54_007364 [Arachnomyces sp. PD_36]
MGRQAYMNRLALGRSPYEAPEPTPGGSRAPTQGTRTSINADGYVQQYDARGHPINPDSRALARQLRRAKNDILSTMGIVVSGEDGSRGASKEKEKLKLLVLENDYGLAMATLDQVSMFVASWWTRSLGNRIQTFKSYTNIPLMHIMREERRHFGFFGFYGAGIPATLSALSDNERYTGFVQSVFSKATLLAKSMLSILVGQTYMFSLLQSLHLIPSNLTPTLHSLIPFTPTSLIQLPPIPNQFSWSSIFSFGFNILTAPITVVYLYVYLRPVVEARIYRMLRRRFPKPDRPDELSIRVAIDNDLIEWTVPTLGRRADEETRRSNFTLREELEYEAVAFKNWILGIFRFNRQKGDNASGPDREERIESLHHRIEQLQRDLSNNPIPVRRLSHVRSAGVNQADARQLQSPEPIEGAEVEPTATTQASDQVAIFDMDQVLHGEENRMAQSPAELPVDYFGDAATLGRTGMDETSRPIPGISSQLTQIGPNDRNDTFEAGSRRPHSRSNTLFSRPSSPEPSPLASPRVRASLVHQNSDVITMQLELLQSSRNSGTRAQTGGNANPSGAIPNGVPQQPSPESIDRAASELLDTILSNNGNALSDAIRTDRATDNETLSAPTTDAESSGEADSGTRLPELQRTPAIEPVPNPDLEGTHMSANAERDTPTINGSDGRRSRNRGNRNHPRSNAEIVLPTHRVTILSSHPVDALSSHIASLLTTTLFLPFEALYLRSLASSFLSSPALTSTLPLGAAATTIGLSSDVRGLGVWFGGGTRWEMFAYAGKMALVLGMQAAVSTGIWGIGSALAIALGRKGFGWGTI